jgi:hypothetical protein
MKKNKYSPKDYERVLTLYRLGYRYVKISKTTGIPESTIYGWYASKKKPISVWTVEEKKARYDKTSEDKNTGWKGNNANSESARKRARKKYLVPKGYQIHHIDGNPYNNNPENIKIVTGKEHMIIDGRLKKLNDFQKTRIDEQQQIAFRLPRDEKGRFSKTGVVYPDGTKLTKQAKYMREYRARKSIMLDEAYERVKGCFEEK